MEKPTQSILREAADWFVRLQESPDAREEFDSWLLRSPAHIEAFLRVSQAWGDLGSATESEYSSEALISAARADAGLANVTPIGKLASAPQARIDGRRRLRFASLAAAAALLAVASAIVL